jgi:NADH dehydrogenase/NADH:ubiquinone oxidoreductase subunit G
LEKESTFINLEGRNQKTELSVKGPALARDDSQILKTIFAHNIKNDCVTGLFDLENFEKNSLVFTKHLYKRPVLLKKKIFKTSLKSVLSNFFVTNAITKNSLVMSKCFLVFKQNYNNFI